LEKQTAKETADTLKERSLQLPSSITQQPAEYTAGTRKYENFKKSWESKDKTQKI